MSDWNSMGAELDSRTPVQCILCKFLASADPDVRDIVSGYISAADLDGWTYSAESLAKALRSRGVRLSGSAVKRHRSQHVQ